MVLVAFICLKGSPGTTTSALAVAAAHPDAVFLECDPSGGDIAAQFGLATQPGLVTLAAAVRHDTSAGLVGAHTQRLPGGLAVVPGPVGTVQAAAAVEAVAERAGPVLGGPAANGQLVVADCGRVWPQSPALPILSAAAMTVLVTRPTLTGIAHVAAAVDGLRGLTRRLCLVLIGEGIYPAGQVGRAVETPVIGQVPLDVVGARIIAGETTTSAKAASRTRLARAARYLTSELLTATAAPPPAAAVAGGTDPLAAFAARSAGARSNGESARRGSPLLDVGQRIPTLRRAQP